MLGLDPPVAGFTTFAAEGHGMSFDAVSVGERVRGRVERTVIVAVVPRRDADRLVEIVRERVAVAHVAFWIEPVLACGRLSLPPADAAVTSGALPAATAGAEP